MKVCKESRAIGLRVLLNALATKHPQGGIRFDPEITAIRIHNFDDLLAWVDDKKLWGGTLWLYPQSFRGQGITTLVVDAEHFWQTDPPPEEEPDKFGYFWGMYDKNWVHILKALFKDAENVIAKVWPTDPGYSFWPQEYDDDEEEEEEDEDEDEDGDSEVTKHYPRLFKSNNCGWIHLDRLERMMADMFANVNDDLAKEGCFNPRRSIYRKRPNLLFSEGVYREGVVSFTIPVFHEAARTCFEALYSKMGF